MIKKRTSWRDGYQEAVCGGFKPRFFEHQPSQKSKLLTCYYLVPRFSVTPYLVPIGKVDLKKKCFHPQTISFFFQIKAAAQITVQVGFA